MFKNKLTIKILTMCVMIGFVTTGCQVFNPYEAEFDCPDVDKGRCMSIQKAYAESRVNQTVEEDLGEEEGDNVNPLAQRTIAPNDTVVIKHTDKDANTEDYRYSYTQNKYKVLAGLIGEPETPILMPPQVMRVLMLPYTSEQNQYFGWRYVYFLVSQPQWIMSINPEAIE